MSSKLSMLFRLAEAARSAVARSKFSKFMKLDGLQPAAGSTPKPKIDLRCMDEGAVPLKDKKMFAQGVKTDQSGIPPPKSTGVKTDPSGIPPPTPTGVNTYPLGLPPPDPTDPLNWHTINTNIAIGVVAASTM